MVRRTPPSCNSTDRSRRRSRGGEPAKQPVWVYCTISTSTVSSGAYDPVSANQPTSKDVTGGVTSACPPGVVTPIGPWKSCLLWQQQPPSAVASSEAVRKYRLVADLNGEPLDVVGVVAGGANRHFTPRVALRRIVDVASGSRSRGAPRRRRSARSLSRPAVVARWCSQETAPRCSAGTDSRSRSSRRTLCLGSEGASTASDKGRYVNSPRRTPLMLRLTQACSAR